MHRRGAALHDAIPSARFLGEEMDRCAVLHQGQHPKVVLLPVVLPQNESDGVGAGDLQRDRGHQAETVSDRVRGPGRNCGV